MAAACIAVAAATYGVSRPAIETVLSRPWPGGVGPMHIPSAWLPILARVGFARAKVADDRCTNIEAGAWIMAFETWQSAMKAPAPDQAPAPALPPSVEDLGRQRGVTAACVTGAAQYYHLPPALFSAVLRTEGGQVGQVHWNSNGSYDIGPAQINSTWLPTLAHAGITRSMVLNDGCLNVSIGAWILAQAMEGADPGQPADYWRHVGDYNSHTPSWNARYALRVWSNLPR